MKERTYSVGVNVERERLTITVNLPLPSIPFSVWRDAGRCAVSSISTPDKEVFEFLTPNDLAKAESILQGGLFRRKDE